jgi:putative two-component system response regulator
MPAMIVLFVDDDSLTPSPLEKSMSKWGYNIIKAQNGQQALEQIKNNEIDIIVSDRLTSDMNGLQLCQSIRALDLKRYIYFLIICDGNNHADVVRGRQNGIDDYMTRPLNHDELQARLEIGARIIRLERELNQKFLAIKRNYYQSIHMFTQMLETYSKELGGHSRRVGRYALQLANRHPDIAPEDYMIIEDGALLHDIGLIGQSETLVTKSMAEMTGDERNDYQAHPERGELILNQVDLLRPVAKIVRMHHEQPNGRGFPDGLSDKQIPLAASVVGAASIYDHLVHHKKIPPDKIPEQLQQYRGYQICSDLVAILLEINLDRIEEEAKRTFREIDIEELQAGMVLANDIHIKTGAFVMGADTCIDASVIEKLKRYRELGNISPNVFIKK